MFVVRKIVNGNNKPTYHFEFYLTLSLNDVIYKTKNYNAERMYVTDNFVLKTVKMDITTLETIYTSNAIYIEQFLNDVDFITTYNLTEAEGIKC